MKTRFINFLAFVRHELWEHLHSAFISLPEENLNSKEFRGQ